MFSTVLKEVTGYFDRRALVSAFFPTLVFLVGAALVADPTDDGLLTRWEGLSGTAQLLVLIGVLVLVAFWTFALINTRDTLERLYQGYWPQLRGIRAVTSRRTEVFRQRRGALLQQDRLLEAEAAIAHGELVSFPQPDDVRAPGASQPLPGDESLAVILERLAALLASITAGSGASAAQGTSDLVRRAWTTLIEAGEPVPDGAAEQLTGLTESLRAELDRRERQLGEQRLQLHRRLFLGFPLEPESVRPTELGNALRATERYPWQRYRMDAVVIWPRMQSLLPAEFTQLLDQSKTSLDLALTLSTYCGAIGVPVAVVAGLRPDALVQQILLVALLAGLAAGLAYGLYRNAIRAAMGYGELVRAAFDLHRWRVLEAMHLRRPANLAEERRLWEQVSIALYRGSPPDPDYFSYVESADTKPPPRSHTTVSVAAAALPRFHAIRREDVRQAQVSDPLPPGAVTAADAVIGRVTLMEMPAGTVFSARHVAERADVAGTRVVAVTVSANAFRVVLGAGDRVDLIAAHPGSPAQVIAPDVLVVEMLTPAAGHALDFLVAVQAEQQDAVLAATFDHRAELGIVLRIDP